LSRVGMGDLVATEAAPWFVVRSGVQRKCELIRIPFKYVGSETLSETTVHVVGEHIRGVSSEEDGPFYGAAELGDLVSGDEFELTVQTDGDPGWLTFVLDVLANGEHPRKLRVDAPEPVSVPLITEREP
jgi:hypothetical protein